MLFKKSNLKIVFKISTKRSLKFRLMDKLKNDRKTIIFMRNNLMNFFHKKNIFYKKKKRKIITYHHIIQIIFKILVQINYFCYHFLICY